MRKVSMMGILSGAARLMVDVRQTGGARTGHIVVGDIGQRQGGGPGYPSYRSVISLANERGIGRSLVAYIHIGLPKTGTTSLQAFFRRNRRVLRNHGVVYPDTTGSNVGNGTPAALALLGETPAYFRASNPQYAAPQLDFRACWLELLAEAVPGAALLVSSEEFGAVPPSELATANAAGLPRGLLSQDTRAAVKAHFAEDNMWLAAELDSGLPPPLFADDSSPDQFVPEQHEQRFEQLEQADDSPGQRGSNESARR